MTKTELLAALNASRAELETELAALTEDQLIQPNTLEAWSVKDMLSHLTAWEAELVTALAKSRAGQTPKLSGGTPEADDAVNDQWYHENKDRPLDRVLADLRGVRKQTLRQVEALTESDLGAPKKWLKQKPLLSYILSSTVEHEAEHIAHLRAWRASRNTP